MAQVTMELRKVLELQNFNLFDFEYEKKQLKKEKEPEQKADNYKTLINKF